MVECSSCGTMYDTPYCPQCGQKRDVRQRSKFFKGTFDSIPFLNDDAKRTIAHLIFRPGYMIKDYIGGKHGSYLAPMTSLIVFYAFFALVQAICMPTLPQEKDHGSIVEQIDSLSAKASAPEIVSIDVKDKDDDVDYEIEEESVINLGGLSFNVENMKTIYNIYVLMNLDTHPDAIDTPAKASLAAFEATLRSQGLYQFLGSLIILTLAFRSSFKRKYGMRFAASASAAAYILCQLCLFRLVALLLSWGHSAKLGFIVLLAIITFDLSQLLDIHWKPAVRKAFKLGCWYLVWTITAYVLIFLLFSILPAFSLNLPEV